jgi:hypothetical protein
VIWRLEIQRAKGGAWEFVLEFQTSTGVTGPAWKYLAFLRKECGLDYYAAQVYRLPAG